jgi:hypothetical protein
VETIAAVAVLLGSISQATTGFGFSLVSAPFLVAAYGAPAGVQLNIVLSIVLNVLLVATGWRTVDRRAVGRLLAPAAVATLLIGPIIKGRDTDGLTVAAGVLCLVGVGMVTRSWTHRRLTGSAGAIVTGALSGSMNVVAGIGGPPVVLFGTTAGWSPEISRPTLQTFFLGINLVALATLGAPSHLPSSVGLAMVAGFLVGRPLVSRLHAGQVRVAVLVIAAAGSIVAIVRGLT